MSSFTVSFAPLFASILLFNKSLKKFFQPFYYKYVYFTYNTSQVFIKFLKFFPQNFSDRLKRYFNLDNDLDLKMISSDIVLEKFFFDLKNTSNE